MDRNNNKIKGLVSFGINPLFLTFAMRWVIIICFLSSSLIMTGQVLKSPPLEWQAYMGGDGSEEIHDLIELPNQKLISVGFTTTRINKSDDQYFTIVDNKGKINFEKNYGSVVKDDALAVAHTFDGNWIYTGYVNTSHYVNGEARYSLHPNIRKMDIEGKVLWTKIETSVHGFYSKIIETSPGTYVVIGEDKGKALIGFYNRDSLMLKKTISDASIKLYDVISVSNNRILVTGETVGDHFLWYGLADQTGNLIWYQKGPKNMRMGKSILKESEHVFIIGGEYFDPKNRVDAYIIKIDIQDGNILSKSNYGGKYEDNLNDISYDTEGNLVVVGNTNSHMRGGARRKKAWLVKIDPKTLTQKEEYIWGGNQNNDINSVIMARSGNLVLGGWTSSGDAEGRDGWLQKMALNEIMKTDAPKALDSDIKIKEISLLEKNKNDTIELDEEVAFTIRLQDNVNVSHPLSFRIFIDDILNNQVLISRENLIQRKFIAPVYKKSTVSGIQKIRFELISSNEQIVDSLSRSYFFEEPAFVRLSIIQNTALLRNTLDSGMAVIDIPVKIFNNGSLPIINYTFSFQGLEDKKISLDQHRISLLPGEDRLIIVSLKANDYGFEDSTFFDLILKDSLHAFRQRIELPIKLLLAPYVQARKYQSNALIAQKIQAGNISPIKEEEYKRLPLDSFFLKQSKFVSPPILSVKDEIDFEKIFMFWSEPDPVIHKNYIQVKRDKHFILIKLINQNKTTPVLTPKLIIQRPDKITIDTVSLSLDQGVLLGAFQFNIQADILLKQGENKITPTLWQGSELVKSATTMIINYQPPRNNLFVYAYGVADPSLENITKDARDFANAFENQGSKIYSAITTKVFNTKELTASQSIRKSVRDIVLDYTDFKRIRKDDVLLIYFSSHGILVNNEFYLVPSDYDPLYEEETAIHMIRDIQSKLRDLPCKKLLFIDACHSGASASIPSSKEYNQGTKSIDPFDKELADALIKLSESSNDFYFLLSSSAGEVSYTDPIWGNSAFTKAILEAFSNKPQNTLTGQINADTDQNKILDLKELYLFLRERVPVIIQSKKNLKTGQTPYTPDVEVLKNIPVYVVEK